MSNDLVADIVALIKSEWDEDAMTNKFTPEVTSKWWTQAWNARRVITVRELFADHSNEDLGANQQRVNASWQLDVWADDRTDVMDMREELDSIIDDHNNAPVSGITFMAQKRWADNSFLEREIFRYTLDLFVICYRSS